jgi:hypothetical protein
MCDGRKHNLIDILFEPGDLPGLESVVRWCSDCGAIVIDSDIDGRTWPGKVMKMRFPKITIEKYENLEDGES